MPTKKNESLEQMLGELKEKAVRLFQKKRDKTYKN